jgi:hypothetical protein
MSITQNLPDFDTLVALYKTDPAAYEEVRRRLLRSCIDKAPVSHRPALELIYRRIEKVHADARTPLEAVVGASRLMLDSCSDLRGAMSQLQEATAAMQTAVLLDKFRL